MTEIDSSNGSFIIFSQGVGYGMVVGVGAVFALVMGLVSWILTRYMNEVQDSEMLSTAKRSIKSGLIASAVVSSWTIGSTLLLSVTTTYDLGIAGAWWYGAGACVQIIIFATMAIELKRKAPNAHTFQEVVKVRYGTIGHLTMCAYSIGQQLVYTANLLVNGSSVFANLTGMNREACTVLLPFFVIIYTLIGGIKATFLTDWTHVVIIYVVMTTFLFKVYTTSDVLGSTTRVWELLTEAAVSYPVEGNEGGSYLTFTSVNGGLFGLILFGAGWAASVDSQLFQKAIAANPAGALTGYTLGGLCWFTLPFALATTMGLACRALENTASFPIPGGLTTEQLSNGLALPISAYAIMGKGGAGAILLMVFMAVTAAYSSETVAVASLLTYDIYKSYINPKADGKRLVWVTHLSVVGFSVVAIGLAIGFGRANFDVSFITTASGIVVNVCVVPMICTLFWDKVSCFSFVATTTLSTCISVAVWVGYSYSASKDVTILTLSTYKALAAGNTAAVFVPLVILPIFTFIKPAKFDWTKWKTEISQVDDSSFDKDHGLTNVLSGEEVTEMVLSEEEAEDAMMIRKRNIGIVLATIFVLFFIVLFPMPLYGTHYIFGKTFFRGYIVVTFLWVFFSVGVVTVYPVFESMDGFKTLYKNILGKGRSQKLYSDDVVSRVTSSRVERKADESKLDAVVGVTSV
ncbi:hypothetical protein OGAPHI_004532 [Ogataea philodendri]|uniref:Urea active transporter n=1 Tax=Ogataea philodendri TaxID=1378263 RepID=A0A9P8P6C8_9ASCO|nr:uncharacterized protein OGAPHI_004532 [Ogataea philodendri]KAH3666343.1 hypothetical protein OGAPHI_004532 [Ogataea philodendri]